MDSFNFKNPASDILLSFVKVNEQTYEGNQSPDVEISGVWSYILYLPFVIRFLLGGDHVHLAVLCASLYLDAAAAPLAALVVFAGSQHVGLGWLFLAGCLIFWWLRTSLMPESLLLASLISVVGLTWVTQWQERWDFLAVFVCFLVLHKANFAGKLLAAVASLGVLGYQALKDTQILLGWLAILLIFLVVPTFFENTMVKRKLIHLAGILTFGPGLKNPHFLGLAWLGVSLGFHCLDTFRMAVPDHRLSVLLNRYGAHYLDARESTEVMWITPLFFLLGMGSPIWLETNLSQPEALKICAAPLVLGVGDSCAGLVGKLWGKPVLGMGKSLEGFLAFVVCSIGGCLCFGLFQEEPLKIIYALAFSGLFEATYRSLDNLALPVYFWCFLHFV